MLLTEHSKHTQLYATQKGQCMRISSNQSTDQSTNTNFVGRGWGGGASSLSSLCMCAVFFALTLS